MVNQTGGAESGIGVRISLLLKVAGAAWLAWSAWLLIYAWTREPEFWVVAYGPPMVCFAYGIGLVKQDAYVAWLGWVILAVLVASGAINGLLVWPLFVVFLGLQAALALFTTLQRRKLLRA
jgi:hypothetical protein